MLRSSLRRCRLTISQFGFAVLTAKPKRRITQMEMWREPHESATPIHDLNSKCASIAVMNIPACGLNLKLATISIGQNSIGCFE